MKTLILVLLLGTLINTWATKGGGGGNFHYMRSLEALTETEIDKILEKQGADFLQNVVKPAFFDVHLLGVMPKYFRSGKSVYKRKSEFYAEGLGKTLKAVVGDRNYSDISKAISKTQLKSCSCKDVHSNEYSQNHLCSIPDSNTICIDKEVIFNPKNNISFDFHELTGMIWHETTHILGAGEIEHQNAMPVYRTVTRMSRKDQLSYFSSTRRPIKCRYNLVSSSGDVTSEVDREDGLTSDSCFKKAVELSKKYDRVTLRVRGYGLGIQIGKTVLRKADRNFKEGICHVRTPYFYFADFHLAEFDGDFSTLPERNDIHNSLPQVLTWNYRSPIGGTNHFVKFKVDDPMSCFEISNLIKDAYGDNRYYMKGARYTSPGLVVNF